MTQFDILRPPSPLEFTAQAYKEWFHLNIFDHGSGMVGVINASLHGDPRDPRSRAVGTALIHVPGEGWRGNVEVRGAREARVGDAIIGLRNVAMAIDHSSRTLLVSARLPEEDLVVDVAAMPAAPAVTAIQPFPFGQGWISWYAIPRVRLTGGLYAGDGAYDLVAADGYHDHNWGRWHWGDNVGWEWGAFLAPESGPSLVLTRITDRAHGSSGDIRLVLDIPGSRRTFAGKSVRVVLDGSLEAEPLRLPGALATLHQDRGRPLLPSRIQIRADDGRDTMETEFRGRAVCQLIAGDPAIAGYGFIHEIVGTFTSSGRIGREFVETSGLGVFEYVD